MDRSKKLEIINEGKKRGVTKVCTEYNISRTLYYRWLSRYTALGISGLEDVKREYKPKHKISQSIEFIILDLIKNAPTLGAKEIKYQLEDKGYMLSESGVYNVMKRHNLTNKNQRKIYSHKRKQNSKSEILDYEKYTSGECWLIWITNFGHFDVQGTVFEYTIMDLSSRIACSRLYTDSNIAMVSDLISSLTIPIAQALGFETKTLFFLDDTDCFKKHQNQLREKIHHEMLTVGYDVNISFLGEKDTPDFFKALRQEYTHHCFRYLMSYFYKGEPLIQIKRHLQTYIRNYNISSAKILSDDTQSPIAYHLEKTKHKVILPLWAYMERDY